MSGSQFNTILITNIHLKMYTGIVTWFFPCYTAGRNAEAVGESCFLHCLAFYIPFARNGTLASVRGKIRRMKGIAGSSTDDWLNVMFCTRCSLVQEARVSMYVRKIMALLI